MAHGAEYGGPPPEAKSHNAGSKGGGGKGWIEGLVGGMAEGAWDNGMGFVEAFHKRSGGSSGGGGKEHN